MTKTTRIAEREVQLGLVGCGPWANREVGEGGGGGVRYIALCKRMKEGVDVDR